jgi:hypothetical protein
VLDGGLDSFIEAYLWDYLGWGEKKDGEKAWHSLKWILKL